MLLLFFIISAISAISIVLLKNKTITKIITIFYALVHIWFTIYCWNNLNKTELSYFTFNGPGVLLLSVLSFLALPTIYHGFIYAAGDEVKKFNIYHAALIALITFMSGAYMANGMTVVFPPHAAEIVPLRKSSAHTAPRYSGCSRWQ